MKMKLFIAAVGALGWCGIASAQPFGQPGFGSNGSFMPNIYNPQSQPLSPYLNMFRGGGNPAANYYFGTRPGTVASPLLLVNVLRWRRAAGGAGWRAFRQDLSGLAVGFVLVFAGVLLLFASPQARIEMIPWFIMGFGGFLFAGGLKLFLEIPSEFRHPSSTKDSD